MLRLLKCLLILNIMTITFYYSGETDSAEHAKNVAGSNEVRVWTHSDLQNHLLKLWNDGGGTNIPTFTLPSSILNRFEITSEEITPEVYFSNEFQSELRALPEDELRQVSIMTDLPPSSVMRLNPNLKDLREYLERFSLEDLKKRYAAMAGITNTENLPDHVLSELSNQSDRMQQALRDAFPYDQAQQEMLSRFYSGDVLEAFNSLHRRDQERLAPLLDRLIDAWSISNERHNMSTAQKRSALRLMHRMRSDTYEEAFELPSEVLEFTKRNVERGFALSTDQTSPIVLLESEILNTINDNLTKFEAKQYGSDYYDLTEEIPSESLDELSLIPAHYIISTTNNFLVERGTGNQTRYFDMTVFGGALTIYEAEVDDSGVFYPNLEIAGRDALIMNHLYKDDIWVTSLSAYNGFRQYIFTLAGKLEGDDRQEFIEFCTEIVESN